MITKENYNKHIDRIGFENLPEELKKAHLVIMSKTDNGNDWKIYEKDEEIKKVVDLAFQKLDEFIVHRGNENLSGNDDHPSVKQAKMDAQDYPFMETEKLEMIYRLEKDAEVEDGLTEEIQIRKSALEKELRKRGVLKRESKSSAKGKKYKHIRKEVAFIMRFLEFHDKVLYKKTFEIFLNDLQASIQKKEITKKSPVAKEIMAMQNAALTAFNTMKHAKHFVLSSATIKRFKKIIEQHENDYDDNYDTTKKKKMPLNGVPENPGLMCSTDFATMKFDSIGFKDKWLELIGDPSKGFTAMVFGKPKMGKSYLCIDFAGYLARNHGKVLYVAKEEKLDATLQKKLLDKDVSHPNLFVSDSLPEDLSAYDFIFLDSVNKLELSPKDLDALKAKNPGKSFIFIFQTTKDGSFRGKNEFQHDVDVVIEIPERGKAVQFGRFNQGGEMKIFPDQQS